MNNFRINNSAVSNSKIKLAIADALRPKDLPLRSKSDVIYILGQLNLSRFSLIIRKNMIEF